MLLLSAASMVVRATIAAVPAMADTAGGKADTGEIETVVATGRAHDPTGIAASTRVRNALPVAELPRIAREASSRRARHGTRGGPSLVLGANAGLLRENVESLYAVGDNNNLSLLLLQCVTQIGCKQFASGHSCEAVACIHRHLAARPEKNHN